MALRFLGATHFILFSEAQRINETTWPLKIYQNHALAHFRATVFRLKCSPGNPCGDTNNARYQGWRVEGGWGMAYKAGRDHRRDKA